MNLANFRTMLRAILPVTGILLSAQATANTYAPFPFMYAGLDVGKGQYKANNDLTAYERSDADWVGGVHLGYQFNHYLSTEVAYQYMGNTYTGTSPEQVTGRFQQLALSGRLGYALTDTFYHYLKLGGAGWFSEMSSLKTNEVEGVSPLYGTGLVYTLNERMTLRFEYQVTHNMGHANIGYANYQQATLGFSWQFGRDLLPRVIIQEKIIKVPVIKAPVIKERIVFAATGTDALFAHNESVLVNPRALRGMVAMMKKFPQTKIMITGHTDDTGSEEYNQRLSERRARAVADYFLKEGINRNKMQVFGKGEMFPVEDNNNEQGRAMNRRVEIDILA